MGSIVIGDVTINDVNQNDLYDANLDAVVDQKGQPLSGLALHFKMAGLLKAIQAKTWQGLSLPDVARIIDGFDTAQQAAQQGHPQEVHDALEDAKDAAKSLKLPLNRRRADFLYRTALLKGVSNNMANADLSAQNGSDVEEIKDFLEEAESYVVEYNVTFASPIAYDQKFADRILESAYQNRIPQSFLEADQAAQQGDYHQVEKLFKETQSYIQEANSEFNLGLSFDQVRADRILQDAYLAGIPLLWQRTENFAQQGQTTIVRSHMTELQRVIAQANLSFALNLSFDQTRADQIMETALKEGAVDNFKLAERMAKAGSVEETEKWLDKAHDYIDEYNQRIAQQKGKTALSFDRKTANQITETAYQNAIQSAFKSSVFFAKKANLHQTDKFLQRASDLVQDFNLKVAKPQKLKKMTFDQPKADQIKDCAAGKQACPSP